MVFTSSRKKNSKFYWLELGFILLGIIGWNPSILTSVFESKGTAVIQQQFPPQYASQLLRPNVNSGAFPTTSYDSMAGQRTAASIDPYAYTQSQTRNPANASYYANPQQLASQQYFANQQYPAQPSYNYGAQNTSGSQYGYPVNTGIQNSQPSPSGYWNNGYPTNTAAPTTTLPPATMTSSYNSQSTLYNWPSTSSSAYSQQNRGYSNGFPTTANLPSNVAYGQYPTYGQNSSYSQYGVGNTSPYQNTSYPPSTTNFNPMGTNINGFVPVGSTANSLGITTNQNGYLDSYQPLNPATTGTRGRY
ncbi:MAG: hypothetical protein ACK56W_09935 [Pirellula sp.]|jgi:hypothetical protein|nr:hypothetical protein [Pirellula sp.]